jgi:hypothetical protein
VTTTGVLTVTPGAPAPADTVQITKAEWKVGLLRVEATSSNPNAILSVYVTGTNILLGTMTNNGGGKYSFQHAMTDNPRSITAKSNFGGSATASTV